MISELAKGDWLDLQAQGLNPTLEDFDRLNRLALRLTDGDETTAANFPRIGWAGDVPFFQPTLQAFTWFHSCALRHAANPETELTLWAFALAHAREPRFFERLDTSERINEAVSAWAESLPVTRDEIARACRYAAVGFDDAHAASGEEPPVHRSDTEKAAANLAHLERRLAKACAVLHVAPDALMCETPTRLDMICEAASVELGREMVKDEAQLRADYGLTLREIMRRLKASDAKSDGENDSGDNQETDHKGDSAEDAEKNEKKVVEP